METGQEKNDGWNSILGDVVNGTSSFLLFEPDVPFKIDLIITGFHSYYEKQHNFCALKLMLFDWMIKSALGYFQIPGANYNFKFVAGGRKCKCYTPRC